MPENFKPIGAAARRVAEEAILKAKAEEAKANKDTLPARAMAFGQPQIVGGTGQWDNVRYFAPRED